LRPFCDWYWVLPAAGPRVSGPLSPDLHRRQVGRPAVRPGDRAVLAGLSRLLSAARRGRFFVPPETLLRWHRDLVKRRWTYSHRRSGRPSLPAGTVSILLACPREPDLGISPRPRGVRHQGRAARALERVGHLAPARHRTDARRAGPTWSVCARPRCGSPWERKSVPGGLTTPSRMPTPIPLRGG
jgi:hypothetical protein